MGRGVSRAYGWTTQGQIIDTEAEVLRAAADDITDGQSFASVVADLNDRGIPTVSGKRWAISPLARILRSPRIIGKQDVDGTLVDHPKAAPILDPDVWEKVVAILDDEDRKKYTRHTRRQHLSSGFFRCGVCGQPAYVAVSRTKSSVLRANCDHVSVDAAAAEAELSERVLSRITTSAWIDALTEAARRGREHYRAQAREAEQRMVVLAETFGEGAAERAAFEAGVAAAQAARDEASATVALLEASDELPGFTDREVVEWWATRARLEDQRSVISTVVDYVEVMPLKAVTARDRYVFHWL